MNEAKELALASEQSSLISIIERAASNKDVDADKVMRLIDAQERIFNKNAQITFNEAMSACQAEMPIVVRDAQNQQTNSKYAKYETILNTAKPCYTKHGFSLSFGSECSPIEGHVRVTCELMHRSGHSKNTFVDLPLDGVGIKGNANKTGIHATGSTYSYGKRYLFCMMFNITLADEDDDGVKSGGVTIEDLLNYNAFIRDNFDAIGEIKEGLANEDWLQAAGAWCDFEEREKIFIWKAPKKGGILTTEERSLMKANPNFTQACEEVTKQITSGA